MDAGPADDSEAGNPEERCSRDKMHAVCRRQQVSILFATRQVRASRTTPTVDAVGGIGSDGQRSLLVKQAAVRTCSR